MSSNQASIDLPLFPLIEPYQTGELKVDEIHTIYWEQCGNPNGVPVIFVHGGPGLGAQEKDRRFFDPSFYRIILFDQRGAGRSRPHGETRNNTTQLLAQDIETLRTHLGIERWHVFGGSWGATLSLFYAQSFPDRVLSLTLRGIFLLRKKELDWWLYGIERFFPERWRAFTGFIPEPERGDLFEAYYKRLHGEDTEMQQAAANAWCRYEGLSSTLTPHPEFFASLMEEKTALAIARMESHYFKNNRFDPEDLLLQNIDRIRHIPAVIVQGRYDMVCPPTSADELHQRWPESELIIVENTGHSSREYGNCAELVKATEKFKSIAV